MSTRQAWQLEWQQRVHRELGVNLVRERLEDLRDGLLKSWLHFGRHRFPIIVQEEIHRVGHDTVAVEQVVQMYTSVPYIQVDVEVSHRIMDLTGLLRLITFTLDSSYDVDIRPIATRQAVSDYGQQQDLSLQVVVRDHFEMRQKQFQSNAVVVDINPEKHGLFLEAPATELCQMQINPSGIVTVIRCNWETVDWT